MKKNALSKLLVIVMVAALMLCITGCGSSELEQLKKENAELKAQVEELTARLESLENRPALEGCTLSGSAWSSNNGATVTITATPEAYDETHTAAVSVRLNGTEVAFESCQWDGAAYVAEVDLEAANGYSYYFIITTADGTPTQIDVNSPENPTDDTLVFMETALSAYANMVMESWEEKEDTLVITSGYIQVQMPRLTADGESAYAGSQLVLKLGGEEVAREAVVLPEGEGAASYEAAISDISFDLPTLEDDGMLELWLEVTLSNGQTIDNCACTWSYYDGTLTPSVG